MSPQSNTGSLLTVGEKELVMRDDEPQSATLMFERLARDQAVDVDKLERLIAMQERILAHNAEAAFNVAFTNMLPHIPTVVERARTDKTSYATLEDIIEAVRPVLGKHGFSLAFRTEWPDAKTVKVFGILTHNEGHARQSEFLSAADQTGSKNAIQALGSAVSYGKRYTAKDLLCIVTREEDDDADKAEAKEQPEAPDGYDAWFATLEGIAATGMKAFSEAWNKSPETFRRYLSSTAPKVLASLKTKAAKVKA
jgi:hypothetical protein